MLEAFLLSGVRLYRYELTSQNCFCCIPSILVCSIFIFIYLKGFCFLISLWPCGCSVAFCFISTCLEVFWFSSCNCLLVSYLCGSGKILKVISVLLNLLGLVLWPNIWSVLEKCFMCTWEECVFCCFWVECSANMH